jgi:hypothetical protein
MPRLAPWRGRRARALSAAGTAPHKCADRQRAAALASAQREELSVDDVVSAGVSAGAEPRGVANPRRGLRRCERQQRSGNGNRGECPSHLAPQDSRPGAPGTRFPVGVSFGELRAATCGPIGGNRRLEIIDTAHDGSSQNALRTGDDERCRAGRKRRADSTRE